MCIPRYGARNQRESINRIATVTAESAMLSWKTSYEDWGFNFLQGYSSSSAPLAETLTPTKQENYATAFQASRQLGSQMSAQFNYACIRVQI